MKILVVEPGSATVERTIANTLTAMQAVVGGSIQAVYPFDEPIALVCHEEGKLLGLPLNRALRHPDTDEVYDIIAGTFFLCQAPPESEQFESLTAEQIAVYTEHFKSPELFFETARGVAIIQCMEETL